MVPNIGIVACKNITSEYLLIRESINQSANLKKNIKQNAPSNNACHSNKLYARNITSEYSLIRVTPYIQTIK